MKVDLTSASSLNKYFHVLETRVENISDNFAKDIMTELKINTPKRTGKLANSYSIEKQEDELLIKNDAGYCKFVNYGTSKQQGQHFIEKSIELAKLKIPEHAKDAQKINN